MFYLERFTKNIGNQISKKISKYNLVFEHPNYWEAVNEIVDGELLISFIKDKDDFKAWIPIIIKKFNNKIARYGKSIKIKGQNYDATNLTKLLDQSGGSNFLKNINKEITININKITNDISETLSSFNLIGYIEKGKFNKIVSKGEFEDGKYLDISLRVDKISNKKKLEIYSDLPKPLLSNYKFFDGLTGGQLLILSSYDDNNNNINLSIENFKVKDAPGLVKLLSLADFGGMVDALSGDGLSFEKLDSLLLESIKLMEDKFHLENTFNKNQKNNNN